MTRQRVPYGHARAALLRATRELFAAQGAAGTTTRAVAQRAGVSEPLIFRYFGSKIGLLTEAVFLPMTASLRGFASRWQTDPEQRRLSTEELVSSYVSRLTAVVPDNQHLTASLVRALLDQPSARGSEGVLLEPLAGLFDELEAATCEFCAERSIDLPDTALAVRLGAILVVASALALPHTYRAGDDTPRNRDVHAHVVVMVCRGLLGTR